MTQVRDILFPNQGMNLDADGKFLKPNQTREVYNFRSGNTEGGNLGDRENMLGNTIETVRGDLPEGNNTSIGSCKDNKNNAIIWFIHNGTKSPGDHCILRYYKDTGLIEKILFEEPLLNFSLSYRINHANVIGDLLYWTDNYNSPRKINLIKASNMTNSATVADNLSYSAITEQILDRIKYPPLYPITSAYANDTSYGYNNLRGKMFQFACIYIYDDYEKSVLSTISKIGLPIGDELSNGDFIENKSTNNRINLSINLSTEEVETIEIYAREGNFGHWKMIKQIFKYDEDGEENILYPSNSTYSYPFYNNQVGIVVDQENLLRPFDYVPLKSACMDIVEGNRIMDANYLEGFNNTDIDIGITTERESIDYDDYIVDINFGNNSATIYDPPIPLPLTDGYGWFIIFPLSVTVGEVWQIQTSQGIVEHIVSITDTLTIVITSILDQLTGLGFLNYDFTPPLLRYHYIACYPGILPYANQVMSGTVTKNMSGITTFKDGAWHEVGIVYSNRAGQTSFVNLDDDNSRFYIPSIGLRPNTQFFKNRVRLVISNLPPDWADYYSIAYSKNTSMIDYVQFGIEKTDIVQNDAISNVEVTINNRIQDTYDADKKFNIPEWNWKKGDRIRFLAYYKSTTNTTPPYLAMELQYLNNSVDMEIIGIEYPDSGDYGYKKDDIGTDFITDSDGNKVRSNSVVKLIIQNFNYEQYGLDDDFVNLILVEVYRPLKSLIDTDSAGKTFYEIGETKAIENGYHKGGTEIGEQDQSATQAAIFYLNGGDSYAKLRVAGNGTYPVYDPNFSDYYDSNFYDIGRVNIVNTEAKQVRLSANLRFSGKYIENTKINELSKVEFNDYDVLSENDGPINKIEYVGFTLKVYQQYKITSIYIGRTSFVDAQGKESLQITNNVIGTKLPSSTRYGTEHPESVVKSERNVYLVDINSKTILRDSPNGIREISGYNVKTWVRNIIETLQGSSYSDLRIYSGYNKRYDEITFTFIANVIALGTDIGYSVVFLEEDFDKGNWNYFPQYVDATGNYPQGYEGIGNLFVSFLKGDIWIHDSNILRNNFYGDQKSIEINLVGNKEFLNVKNYLRMGVNANKAFDVEIKIDPCILYPSGMVSRIKAARFENKEGIWYAEFLKDMTTNSSTPSVDDLINGRPLQGQTIRLKLTNSDTDEVVLNSVIINSFISK